MKLGEQWVEKGSDCKMHMLKAVEPFELCQGCLFNCNQGGCCWKGFDSCHMGNYFIIKDIGILNDEGILPEERTGIYPELEENEDGYYILFIQPHLHIYVGHETKEKLIDAWNRRA